MDHPRPQLRRPQWLNLDGPWQAMLDDDAAHHDPATVPFDRTIIVPYPPEAAASGVHDRGFRRRVWYRRVVGLDDNLLPARDERLKLHFGAVNHRARVWINGRFAVQHKGGHGPFSVDVTRYLDGSSMEIVVQAEDDPHDMHKVRGKMDWELEPHSIWYPRTTGIWRTVWLEKVARSHVAQLRWTADVFTWQIRLDATSPTTRRAAPSTWCCAWASRCWCRTAACCSRGACRGCSSCPTRASTTRAPTGCGARKARS